MSDETTDLTRDELAAEIKRLEAKLANLEPIPKEVTQQSAPATPVTQQPAPASPIAYKPDQETPQADPMIRAAARLSYERAARMFDHEQAKDRNDPNYYWRQFLSIYGRERL